MNPEAHAKFLKEERQYDQEFRAILLKDIPYFHELYAKYHDQKALETAQDLGIYLKKLSKRLQGEYGVK